MPENLQNTVDLQSQSDENLLTLYREEGNQDAFTMLYGRYHDGLVSFLTVKYGDFHHAEDVAQQAFLNVSQHADQFKSGYPFGTWLFHIAQHASVSMHRLEHSVSASPIDDPISNSSATTHVADVVSSEIDPQEALLTKERNEHLHREVRALAPNYRRIVERHFFHDQSCADFAREHGVLDSTVRWRLREALRYARMYMSRLSPFLDDALRAA